MWILGENLEEKGDEISRTSYPYQDSFSTEAGGRTEIVGGAMDPQEYYGANRAVKPLYSAVTFPGDPGTSRMSVVGAGHATQAIDSVTGNKVVNGGVPVIGAWDMLIWDALFLEAEKTKYSILLSDIDAAARVPINSAAARTFIPLYTSP